MSVPPSFLSPSDAASGAPPCRLRERRLALPNNLRQYFWWEFLVEREAAKLKVKSGQDARALMKENFETTLTKEMKSQNVERAVRSNNWQTIDGGVIEVSLCLLILTIFNLHRY